MRLFMALQTGCHEGGQAIAHGLILVGTNLAARGNQRVGGTPKWMVMENPMKMDDLGFPDFRKPRVTG